MDPAYISALSGLAGVLIGGLASFASTWITQLIQIREKNRDAARLQKAELFSAIITEASRLYGDALSHEKDDVTDLVQLYALIARARLVAGEAVIAAAEHSMGIIARTYLAPNRSLHEIRVFAKEGGMDFLRDFSEACREELRIAN